MRAWQSNSFYEEALDRAGLDFLIVFIGGKGHWVEKGGTSVFGCAIVTERIPNMQ